MRSKNRLRKTAVRSTMVLTNSGMIYKDFATNNGTIYKDFLKKISAVRSTKTFRHRHGGDKTAGTSWPTAPASRRPRRFRKSWPASQDDTLSFAVPEAQTAMRERRDSISELRDDPRSDPAEIFIRDRRCIELSEGSVKLGQSETRNDPYFP